MRSRISVDNIEQHVRSNNNTLVVVVVRLGISQFHVQPIFYETSTADFYGFFYVWSHVQIVFTAVGETKKPTRKIKRTEKQFVVRIQTSQKFVETGGSNRRSTKEVSTSLPLYQLHQRSGSLHNSILFYDSPLVSIFFSTYRLRIGLE